MSAELDVARSEYELGVGNALPQSQLDAMQERKSRNCATGSPRPTTTCRTPAAYRKDLERIVGEMFAAETAARKNLDELLITAEATRTGACTSARPR